MWIDLDAIANQTVAVMQSLQNSWAPLPQLCPWARRLTPGRPEGTRLFVTPNKNHLSHVTERHTQVIKCKVWQEGNFQSAVHVSQLWQGVVSEKSHLSLRYPRGRADDWSEGLITPYEVWLILTSHLTESRSQLSPSIRSTTEIFKSLAQRSVCGRPTTYIVHRSFNTSVSSAKGEGVQALNLAMRLTVRGNKKNIDLSVYIRRVTSQVNFWIFAASINPGNFRNVQVFTNPLRFIEHVIVFIMN